MTSKEALNNLIEELKWCCNDGVELTDYDKSMIEPIQKDLEMLGILKEWLAYDKYEKAVMTYRDIPLEIKEKIMKWLDEVDK